VDAETETDRHAGAGPLGWPLRIGWGIGSLGATTLINGVTFVALFFFTNVLGMAPALAGSLLFTARLVDIATDPLMGWISDRTRSRAGRGYWPPRWSAARRSR